MQLKVLVFVILSAFTTFYSSAKVDSTKYNFCFDITGSHGGTIYWDTKDYILMNNLTSRIYIHTGRHLKIGTIAGYLPAVGSKIPLSHGFVLGASIQFKPNHDNYFYLGMDYRFSNAIIKDSINDTSSPPIFQYLLLTCGVEFPTLRRLHFTIEQSAGFIVNNKQKNYKISSGMSFGIRYLF